MSNFHQLHNSLIDMDRVRSIQPKFIERGSNYITIIYHDGSEDCIDCEEPEKAIRELFARLNIDRAYGPSVKDEAISAVVDAALTWDVLYRARQQTIPEDDDLHFACQRLLTTNQTYKAVHEQVSLPPL